MNIDFNYVPNGQTGVSPRVDSEKIEKLIEISKDNEVSGDKNNLSVEEMRKRLKSRRK